MADFSKLRDSQIEPNPEVPTSQWTERDDSRPIDYRMRDTIARIKGMLIADEYFYAEHTLRGILKTITDHQCVTDGQERAVLNIQDKPNQGGTRQYARKWNR